MRLRKPTQFFLDTADVAVIEELVNMGVVRGVTTNPSLFKQYVESLDSKELDRRWDDKIPTYEQVIGEISRIAKEAGIANFSLSYEPTADDVEGIVEHCCAGQMRQIKPEGVLIKDVNGFDVIAVFYAFCLQIILKVSL